jgi:hypothetical protein
LLNRSHPAARETLRFWILLECRTGPEDEAVALIEQRKVWEDMVARGRAKL